MYKTISQCRACYSPKLTQLFSIGDQFVSDFVEKDRIQCGEKVPITLVMCEQCTLIQQLHTAPQDFLYTKHYWYRSGTTQTMRTALKDVVQSVSRWVDLSVGDVVLDIGSNDGTLLRSYDQIGLIRVGFEPATNMGEDARQGVDLLVNDFWSFEKYYDEFMKEYAYCEGVGSVKAKVITACGMFYDLDDPNLFIKDVARALHIDGVFIAQLMCAKQMYQTGDVGNLAHEHLEFYTLESLRQLFDKYKLEIVDVEENDVNGGSYRLYIKHKNARINQEQRVADYRVKQALLNERDPEQDLHNPDIWDHFHWRIDWERRQCMSFLQEEVEKGKKIVVLGASTKGNVILQYYGVNSEFIKYACDKSPEKWARYTVGSGLGIINEEHMRAMSPDYLMIIPYAFKEEFLVREKNLRENGCKFIIPLPKFEVL